MEFKHTSVLLKETIDGLAIKQNGIYVDGTLGGGGHASELCSRLSPDGAVFDSSFVSPQMAIKQPIKRL